MTTGAVRAFLPTIRRLERQMGIPVPARIRILRELEFDLEGLRRQLEAEGLTSEEARARSLEALVPDRRTLRELARMHAPRYARFTEQLAKDRVRFVERSALVVLTVVVLVGGTMGLLRADLFSDPSPFMWPVMGLGAVSFSLVAWQTFAVWVKGNHRPTGQGPRLILLISGLIVLLGVFGAFVDSYAQSATAAGLPTLIQPSTFLRPGAIEWVVRETALLSVSLVLALAGGLAWFVLTQWLTLVSGAHREVLGLDPTQKPQ